MYLDDICTKIALDKLGKPGALVECMVESTFPEDCYGLVGKLYKVRGATDNSLRIEGSACGVIPNRFRLVAEKEIARNLTAD